MAQGKGDIRVRPAHFADADRIADIFFDSVHGIDPDIYSRAEQLAWAPAPVDYDYWRRAIPLHETFVACIDRRVVGFIGLEPEGYIDWLYTQNYHQGQGVASALYGHLENLARERGLALLSVSASDVARPFFERRGFRVLSANQVERQGVSLRNWQMQKPLTA
ncbi:GNAT family N-acetyltransferase [Marinobacterium lutimaris]|uniref:Acetyltransferase, GNAT family n=1 Tax=Marinobacterium lutimaris TaxID=568106 RepID=A0A1H5YYI8_9GAMM|nr:GNAT family N-acetyltransferase [Marinobacterium lutimaris]SEG29094.1 Acetyltransferase, GNAT family [Marinobacterium lutimaris]